MQQTQAGPTFSATDIVKFNTCKHLTNSDAQVLDGRMNRPSNEEPFTSFLAVEGLNHEARYLEALERSGKNVVKVALQGDPVLVTQMAMESGADVIYQATFRDGPWTGKADFLIKTAKGYEVVDTKLSKLPKADALVQITFYTARTAKLQGFAPEKMHILAGDGEMHSYRFADFSALERRMEAEFLSWAANPQPTYPRPIEACTSCDWQANCGSKWVRDDVLENLAGMTSTLRHKFEKADIKAVYQLAALPKEATVADVEPATLDAFRRQAQLQVAKRQSGAPQLEWRAPGRPGHGLAALPKPSNFDIYFDLEGVPDVATNGREYLWGWKGFTDQSVERYRQRWAFSDVEEMRALEIFVDHVVARHKRHPDAHVYHYGAYEQTALSRLTAKYGTRETELEMLLRDNVFVDLLPIMRAGLLTSEGSFSLKSVEAHYGFERAGSVVEAGQTANLFQQAMAESLDGRGVLHRARAINWLRSVRGYNADDLDSLASSHQFLESGRSQVIANGFEISRPVLDATVKSDARQAEDAEIAAAYAALLVGVPHNVKMRNAEQQARWLLAKSLDYYRRESRPEWQEHFRRLEMSPPELFETSGAISGLVHAKKPPTVVGRSYVHEYSFSRRQDFSIKVGDTVLDPATRKSAGTVRDIDFAKSTLSLSRAKNSQAPHPSAVIEAAPIDAAAQRAALLAYAKYVVAHGFDSTGPYQAADSVLFRRTPVVKGRKSGSPLYALRTGGQRAAVELSRNLNGTVLVVQGPPGTGKTKTAAGIVIQGIRDGKRMGVTGDSHAVITNVLNEVGLAAEAQGLTVPIVQRAPADEVSRFATVAADNAAALKAITGGPQVIGGTAWWWSRPEALGMVDVLVNDEAGRTSLPDALAISGCAKDMVLIGDHQQLERPVMGSHPDGVDSSVLEYIVQGDTIARDRGVLLERTYRMSPAITRPFTSKLMYNDELKTARGNNRQRVLPADAFGGAGLRFVFVEHEGRVGSSPEEADVVASIYDKLLGRTWTSRTGELHVLGIEDIIATAAPNSQVTTLRSALRRRDPELAKSARVGTVNRMQGQEAAVSIYSLAASRPDLVARNFEFLFSRERLNVATSRARALAVVVCSPHMLSPNPRNPEQMRMANALIAFADAAKTFNADLQEADVPLVSNYVQPLREWSMGQPAPFLGRELVLG